MARRDVLVAGVMAALLAVGATPSLGCTTVCLRAGTRSLVAYNYDFYPSGGLVLVNKRGTSKRSRLEAGGARWVARYGSVTFTQFGRDSPATGVNEKGLMVSLMWLDETEYAPADDRPTIGVLEWIQYHLDRHGSVAEVVAQAGAVRPTGGAPVHYLFADATGDAAVVEFLGGKLVVHRGETLPVRALANSTYAASLAAFQAARKDGRTPESPASLDRFVRGALLASGEGDPVARGFALLASVAHPLLTRWSIVYDLGAGDIYFKTDTNEAIRHLRIGAFDFSCRTPVTMLDVTAPGAGEAAGAFADYTQAANRALLAASTAKSPSAPRRSEAEIAAIAALPDTTSSCRAAD